MDDCVACGRRIETSAVYPVPLCAGCAINITIMGNVVMLSDGRTFEFDPDKGSSVRRDHGDQGSTIDV